MAVDAKLGGQIAQLKEQRAANAGESLYRKALKRLRRDRLTILMLVLITLLVVFSLVAPLIEVVFNVSHTRTDVLNKFAPIGTVIEDDGVVSYHILGTDDLGRDHLARLAYGGRVTLGIAFFAALISLTIGVALGILMGYYGGLVDDILLWVITTLRSVPTLFLLIIVAAVFRPGALTFTLALGLLGWTGTTRLVRGETLALREREFVIGARSMGANALHIMLRHIAPNLISIVVVTLAIDIGALMLTEAALSFLGLGVQPPTPTWGNMLSNSREFFRVENGWHLVVFPGLMITLSVLCLYVIGDGVRDAFDPTLDYQ
jgi:peptide/nickel transport system permease protein